MLAPIFEEGVDTSKKKLKHGRRYLLLIAVSANSCHCGRREKGRATGLQVGH